MNLTKTQLTMSDNKTFQKAYHLFEEDYLDHLFF